MKNELELDAIIDDYLHGKLNQEEVYAFEALCTGDPAVAQKVASHRLFLENLRAYGAQQELKNKMDIIHHGLDLDTLVEQNRPKTPFIVKIWRRNKAAIAVAASFIMVFVFGVNYYRISSQRDDVQQIARRLDGVENSQGSRIRNLENKTADRVKPINPGRVAGTGFALSTNGYICTNFHVVKNADSVYVQNSNGETFKTQIVYSDPQNDLAILRIADASFTRLPALPYALKTSTVGLGEDIYTLGFPKDGAVLDEGYVSSKTGANGDTVAYQVSLRVNPGNSGGPVLDDNGNIIGVISSRTRSDDAAFAIKSKYILEALRAIPSDSLNNKISKVKKPKLGGMKRTRQVEKIESHIFMVRAY